MPVAHHAPPAVLVFELGMRSKKCLHLGLDRLGQHLAPTFPQHHQQRIVGDTRSWSGQPDNGIFLHRVSFLVPEHHREYATSRLIHHVWMAPGSQGRRYVWQSGRLRSCVRPLDAVDVTAGSDGFRELRGLDQILGDVPHGGCQAAPDPSARPT
jgi:hypothetical protein